MDELRITSAREINNVFDNSLEVTLSNGEVISLRSYSKSEFVIPSDYIGMTVSEALDAMEGIEEFNPADNER